MATKSFIKEFSVDRRNARRLTDALNNSKPLIMQSNVRVDDIKKDKIRSFFKMDG